MGPTYSVFIGWQGTAPAKQIVAALSGVSGPLPEGPIALVEELRDRLWGDFTSLVDAHVEHEELEHDGYSFGWENAELCYNPKEFPHEAIVEIGINVEMKKEDVAAFENLLWDDHFRNAATALVSGIVRDHLRQMGIDEEALTVSAEETEFGYG